MFGQRPANVWQRFTLGLALLGAYTTAASAFEINMDGAKVRAALGVSTVQDLGQGDRRVVAFNNHHFCVAQGWLHLLGTAPTAEAPPSNVDAPDGAGQEDMWVDVERLAFEEVNVSVTDGRDAPTIRALRETALSLAGMRSCSSIIPVSRVFLVRSLFGAANLTDLVNTITDAEQAAAAQPVAEPEGPDTWTVVNTPTSADKGARVILSTDAIGDPDTTLALRCARGKTTVYLLTGIFVGSVDVGEIEIKVNFGNDIQRSEAAIVSTTRRSLFLKNPVAKAVRMLGEDTLSVEYPDIKNAVHSARFDLRGLDKHLPQLREACNW